jgi:hypothetical protein
VDQNEIHDIKVEDFKLISANGEVSGRAEVVNRGSEDEEKVNVELIIKSPPQKVPLMIHNFSQN